MARRVSAVPIIESDRHTVYADGALKAFVFALDYPYFDMPALQLAGLTDGRWAAIGIGDLRLKLEGEHLDRVKWQAHFRTQPYVSSFAQAQSAMGFVAAAQPARFLPLEVTEPEQGTFRWHHEVDRLNVQLRLGEVDLIIGRQAVSFGVGFVWLPADLVGTFSPTEIDQEFKPGVDALRVNIALGEFTELTLVGALAGPRCTRAPGSESYAFPDGRACSQGDIRVTEQHSIGVTRLRTNISDWDVGMLAGWVRGDVVAGLFTVGAIERFRVRSELVYTYDVEWDALYAGSGNAKGDSDQFIRAVFGTDYTFDSERLIVLFTEFYYNGFGTFDKSDYLTIASRPRVAEFGEVFNLGKLYWAGGVNWEPHEKLPVSLSVLANLHDPSFYLSATASYQIGDNAVFAIGAQLPFGKGPQVDLGGDAPLTPRSEFGLYPFIYFAQWKLYF